MTEATTATDSRKKLFKRAETFGSRPQDMTEAQRAKAITGYDLRMRIEALIAGITGKKIKTTFYGTGAATAEGMMILPTIPQALLFTREEAQILLGYTAHEISHQLETDFDIMSRIFSDITKPTKRERQLKEWWNAIEDYRIEKITRREFPGFPIYIGATRHYTAERFVLAVESGNVMPGVTGNPYRIGAVGLTWVGAILNGYPTQANDKALTLLDDDLEAWLRGTSGRLSRVESKQDALDLAEALLDELEQNQSDEQDDDQDGGDGKSDNSQQKQQGDPSSSQDQNDGQETEDDGEKSPSSGSKDDASGEAADDAEPSQKEDAGEENDRDSTGNEHGETSEETSDEDESSEGNGGVESDEDHTGSDGDGDTDTDAEADEGDAGKDSQSSDGDANGDTDVDQAEGGESGEEADDTSGTDSGSSGSEGDAGPSDGKSEGGGGSDQSDDSGSPSGQSAEDQTAETGDIGSPDEDSDGKKDKGQSSLRGGTEAPAPRTSSEQAEAEAEESDLTLEDILEQLAAIAIENDNAQVDIEGDIGGTAREQVQRSQQRYAELKRTIGSPGARTAGVVRRLLAARNRTRTRRNLEQGKLDLKRLVPIVNSSPNIYHDKSTRRDVNTAVSILVDNSISMSGHPIEVCQKAAIVLDSAITGTGTDLEITGFTGSDCNPTIYQYRRFGQRSQAAAASLGSMDQVSMGGTPVSIPILEAHRHLMAHKAPRKIMIIISDGAASDAGRAKEAHDVAVATGCIVFGIGIGSLGAAIGAWCANHQVIDEIDELPNALAIIVQQAMNPRMRKAA